MEYSKKKAKEKRDKLENLEKFLKSYESTQLGVDMSNSEEYSIKKLEYESILNEKTRGSILRSKSIAYEQNEKSSQYFLNLEKRNAVNNTITTLIDENVECSNPTKITKIIRTFYATLFERKSTLNSKNVLTS